MTNSKTQAQQENDWREIRSELVAYFREGDHGPWLVEKREKLWLEYLDLPLAWREKALDGWDVPDNLQERLDIERQARDLDAGTVEVDRVRARVRL